MNMRISQRFLSLGLFVLLSNLNVFSNNVIRLNSNWSFLKGDVGSAWEVFRPVKPELPESVPVWTDNISLPHCYNAFDAVDPSGNYYQGPAWYRTLLEVDNPYNNGRTILYFEGVGQEAEVYIYTKKITSHVGGYDEWQVDITDAVAAFRKTNVSKERFNGKIPLAIRVSNTRDVERIPSAMSDFNLYGGIYRNLYMKYYPGLYLEKPTVIATVEKNGQIGNLKVYAPITNHFNIENAELLIQVKQHNNEKILATVSKKISALSSSTPTVSIDIKKPVLWSPDNPTLYTVTTTLKSGAGEITRVERTGFRFFEFKKHGPFILNGERLLLKGTHRHEDHAGVGAAMSEEQIETEMKLIKDMGANFIRLGHHQQSRRVLELCDELGLIVWEEIPWCRGGLGGEDYKEQSRRMLRNMITQHRNHPSIVLWGLGNENDWPGDFEEFDTLKIQQFMKELHDLSHELDPTRVTAIRRCDFCKDIIDVYSPSIWAGWYRGVYTDYLAVSEREMKRVNHFLHVEWGGDSHIGRHSEHPSFGLDKVKASTSADERPGDATLQGGEARVSRDGDWSESYMVELFDWHLKEQENMPWITGSAFWIFKDFSTPLRPENPIPFVNQKGVVGRDFTIKDSYYVFQSYWSQKPMVRIYSHTWPVRWGDKGEEKTVKVFSNCDEAELFLNGVSQGSRIRNSQDFPAAGLRWNVLFNEGKNHLKVVAKKGRTVVVDELTQEYQTEKWGKPSKMELKEIDRQNGVSTIEVKVYDANGVFCPDASQFVHFDITGDGELIENLGTVTGSGKIQLQNGRARIRIQLNDGKSIASVKSNDMLTVLYEL